MKNLKKVTAILMVLVLAFGMLAGCGEKVPTTVTEVVNVGALNGPTGMGMVQLMDMTDKYNLSTYQAPTDVTAKIIKGELDVAAVPSNLASVLYNKTEGQVVAVSPIALGVLYILGNDVDLDSVADLKGKTIVASGQGGTPEYVLQKVLENAGLTIYEDVQVQWLANHAEVNTKLLTQEDTIAMIPEPFVSTALAAGNDDVEVEFDMNQLWKDATGQELPMGVLVATKSFVTERENDLKVLLNDLQASVDFVNESKDEAAKLIVEKGFIGKEPIAKAAIPNCHIVLYTGDNAEAGKDILKTFNQTLFEMNKASVGGSLPGDELYY
ncbi:MAG: ABC transporter substrate-binding protein [Firmicutes bacterium]|nr:ABC transporter substrate-binding protein [Bacillota bacterium]